MTGTPVSVGCVKARVCVAEDITEADAIQVSLHNTIIIMLKYVIIVIRVIVGRYSDHILDRHRLESVLPSAVGHNHRNRWNHISRGGHRPRVRHSIAYSSGGRVSCIQDRRRLCIRHSVTDHNQSSMN